MRVFIFLFVAVLLFFALFIFVVFLIARYLVRVALYRKAPRGAFGEGRLRDITGDDRFVDMLYFFEKRLRERDTDTVEILGCDGIKLVGHFFRVESARRIIIAVHGWRSSWSRDFGVIYDFWQDSESSVLFIEQRAQRGSEGNYITFGILERYDLLEWVRWLDENNTEGLPIYLCGVSMGASTVLMSSELPLPDSVHGIISDCGFTAPEDIWRHVVNNTLHLHYNLYSRIANHECKRLTGYGAKDCSTVHAVSKCKVPVLFIHGTDDTFVPISMTYDNYKACASPKRLFVVPGANHGMSYYVDKGGYETEMQRFWSAYD